MEGDSRKGIQEKDRDIQGHAQEKDGEIDRERHRIKIERQPERDSRERQKDIQRDIHTRERQRDRQRDTHRKRIERQPERDTRARQKDIQRETRRYTQ